MGVRAPRRSWHRFRKHTTTVIFASSISLLAFVKGVLQGTGALARGRTRQLHPSRPGSHSFARSSAKSISSEETCQVFRKRKAVGAENFELPLLLVKVGQCW